MDGSETQIPQTLQWAAQNFMVDRVTAEVAKELGSQGIECIVLKGPAIALWLYAKEAPRLYADSDLLIRHADWEAARAVMSKMGFHDALTGLGHPRMESGEGYPWKRPTDGADVDLHYTLFGLKADPETVWEALRADAQPLPIGGTKVLGPSHAAILLHITLHAVQHGGEDEQTPMRALDRRPMVDLERAISRASQEEWFAAVRLGERLEATGALAAGLSLLPAGRELFAHLGIEAHESSETQLRLGGVPMSEGFAELAELEGLGAKIRLMLREVFPTPEFMRWWKPFARRSPVHLGLTYLWRIGWLSYRALPGYLAWQRAAREGDRVPRS